MIDDQADAELRAAVEERLAARLDQNRTRRDARRQRLTELHERRRHGLTARHRAKLNRPNDHDNPTP